MDELLIWMPPPGAAITPVQVTLLPEIWMAFIQHEPAPESSVGNPAAAGLIVALPLIVIRPVATIVTPVRAGDDCEIVTSPAT